MRMLKKTGLVVLLSIAGLALAQDPWSREGTISTDMSSYAAALSEI